MAAAISGVQLVTPEVLAAMDEMSPVAPAHNPPYITAMRLLRKSCPRFRWWRPSKPAFTRRSPTATAITPSRASGPTLYHVRRWGFHGRQPPLHRRRTAEIARAQRSADHFVPLGRFEFVVRDSRRAERSHEHGHEPADRYRHTTIAWEILIRSPWLLSSSGRAETLAEVLDILAAQSGLAGPQRHQRRRAATWKRPSPPAVARGATGDGCLTWAPCGITWGDLVELGGADVVVFTGGIGENGPQYAWPYAVTWTALGLELDPAGQCQRKRGSADSRHEPAARSYGSCRQTKKSS